MHTVVLSEMEALDVVFQRDRLADGSELVVADTSTEAAVTEHAATATILVTAPDSPVTRHALEAADPDGLRAILQASTGVDNVDVEAAADLGIPVANVPSYCTDEVATHAIGLLLAARRQIPAHDRETRAGEWGWQPDRPMPRLAGSTLGIVSFGDIARRVATFVSGFDLDLLAYDPYVDPEVLESNGATPVDFDELLERSDAVTIHAPLTPETRTLFDEAAFEALPDHAVVVNVGRGGIVDETALCRALESDAIAAAALDVFEQEPPGESPLLDRDDVVVTPHSAWYSEHSYRKRNEVIAANIDRVLDGTAPEHVVEPEVDW